MAIERSIEGYFLGCPIWGMKDWVGTLYRRASKPREFLAQYSSVFNTVEGNTTFYHLPKPHIVERWRDDTPADFRFSFKLWRAITHERHLVGAAPETAEFFERLAPLGERLGPFMIQLPPSFGPGKLGDLDRFLKALPSEFEYTVELRHPDFFHVPEWIEEADALLAQHGCGRTIFDTRALRSGDGDDPDVRVARGRKPNLPTLESALGNAPLLRFIGHKDPGVNRPWLEHWLPILVRWIGEGRRPYVMIHTPDDLSSPELARELHKLLQSVLDLPPMPIWPAEERPPGEQLFLFD